MQNPGTSTVLYTPNYNPYPILCNACDSSDSSYPLN